MSSPGVPRCAVFDDLREGQWVALLDKGERDVIVFGGFVGKVEHIAETEAVVNDTHEKREQFVTLEDCKRGLVTILRDPPAPPVTVPRELIDNLQTVLDKGAEKVDARTFKADLYAHELEVEVRRLLEHASEGNPT